MADIEKIAAEVFGCAQLRPGQADAAGALAGGRDCLAVLPSGAGKSAVYQLAALALGGPAVVVSPLLSLQRDQAEHLRRHGLTAIAVNGASPESNRDQAYALLRDEAAGFVFLAPEQLARADVREVLAASPPRLLAVDEAHCVSAWGHEFRPDYLRIGDVLGSFSHRPVVAALTATAAPPVREEIVRRLRLDHPARIIRGFDRPEINLAVESHHDADAKQAAVYATVAKLTGTGIVYAATRKETEEYAAGLGVRPYHAGLSRAEREKTPWPGSPDAASPGCSTCWRSREHGPFAPGLRVEHTEWGRGVVLSEADERLTVFFDEVGYKELLTETVLEGHILTPIAAEAA